MLDLCNRPRSHTIALDKQSVRLLGHAVGEGPMRDRLSRINVALCLGQEPTSWRGRAMPGEHRDAIDLSLEELRSLMECLFRRAFWTIDPRPMTLYRQLCRQFPFAAAVDFAGAEAY